MYTEVTLKHHKKKIQEMIEVETNNPQNWRIKNWLNDETVQIKRLLNDMVRQNLITIEFQNDNGKIRRVIKNKFLL